MKLHKYTLMFLITCDCLRTVLSSSGYKSWTVNLLSNVLNTGNSVFDIAYHIGVKYSLIIAMSRDSIFYIIYATFDVCVSKT